jgi:large subunit ribosomal protein L18
MKKINLRENRIRRIRAKISGSSLIPRLSVFRSNEHIYCQLINDELGKTYVAASDLEIKSEKSKKTKSEIAYLVGQKIGEKAITKKIKKVVFDRGGFKYHGRVKSLADGARKSGLDF